MLLRNSVQKIFVSGGAGFIGSHAVDLLKAHGYHVTVYDNLSNGRREFIEQHMGKRGFAFVEADMLDLDRLEEALRGHDLVWHLAANTDIIGCHKQPERDLRDCVEATFNMVEAMRRTDVKPILFSSSGAVYGDLCYDKAVSEAAGPLLPVSGYGAGKTGSEAFISSYCSMYGLRGWIFRFGNVIGGRMTHGVICDFINKLRANPEEIEILGDGKQEKNYFLVEECVGGMAYAFNNVPLTDEKPCDVFNLGAETITPVLKIADIVKEEMGLPDARISIAGTRRAWPGDQPKVHIRIDRMRKSGWSTRLSSDEAVRIAVRRMLGKDQDLIF